MKSTSHMKPIVKVRDLWEKLDIPGKCYYCIPLENEPNLWRCRYLSHQNYISFTEYCTIDDSRTCPLANLNKSHSVFEEV